MFATAVSHHQAGRLEEAGHHCSRVLSQEPDHAPALHLLGVITYQRGNARRGVELIGKAVALRPDHADAHSNMGIALVDLDKLDDAAAAFRKAVELQPNHADAHSNLGNVLRIQGKLDEAVDAFRAALVLNPNHAEAHNNLGNALQLQGKLEEAVTAFRKAVELKPDYAVPHHNLGNALNSQGQLDEAMSAYRMALALKPGYAKARSNLLLCMNYNARTTQQEIFAESRRWDEAHAVSRTAHRHSPRAGRNGESRLRIGYISPDFREHAVSYFLDPVIAGHDRRSFEVLCYAEVAKPDGKTARFRDLSDGWCSTVGMADKTLAERIRADGIDILVDLAGHTARNRLLVFAERSAPVQVTWLGYPNTTGLSAMDYRLTDAIADPEGDADALHSETLVRLPNGFFVLRRRPARPILPARRL